MEFKGVKITFVYHDQHTRVLEAETDKGYLTIESEELTLRTKTITKWLNCIRQWYTIMTMDGSIARLETDYVWSENQEDVRISLAKCSWDDILSMYVENNTAIQRVASEFDMEMDDTFMENASRDNVFSWWYGEKYLALLIQINDTRMNQEKLVELKGKECPILMIPLDENAFRFGKCSTPHWISGEAYRKMDKSDLKCPLCRTPHNISDMKQEVN